MTKSKGHGGKWSMPTEVLSKHLTGGTEKSSDGIAGLGVEM